MEQLFQAINSNLVWVLSGFLLVQLIVIILLIRQGYALKTFIIKQKRLFKGTSTGNLEEILASHLDRVEKVGQLAEKVDLENQELKEKLAKCLQRVGFVRFSAFENTGSDLSFSAALLDEKGDGILISSLYGREESRTYAKALSNGTSTYNLSEEEKQAIKAAQAPDH